MERQLSYDDLSASFVDFSINTAIEELKNLTYERHAIQLSLLKYFLAVISVLTPLESAFLYALHTHAASRWLMLAAGASCVLSCAAFFLTVFSMLGESGGKYYRPIKDSYTGLVWKAAQETVLATKYSMLGNLDDAISATMFSVSRKGKKIRHVLYLLMASMLIFALTFICWIAIS